jgi:hypothetical protein
MTPTSKPRPPSAYRLSSKVKDNVTTTLLAGPNLIVNKS